MCMSSIVLVCSLFFQMKDEAERFRELVILLIPVLEQVQLRVS